MIDLQAVFNEQRGETVLLFSQGAIYYFFCEGPHADIAKGQANSVIHTHTHGGYLSFREEDRCASNEGVLYCIVGCLIYQNY